ncbi:hypothetical protein SEUCBS140593_010707 [Sporothrix eucalyptigena]|uniref:Uncharacterized protein n=1 Tax=Sporothrix eucalyptigena TaxID=1812306 RepID=A0ABP0D3N1_9PEZI
MEYGAFAIVGLYLFCFVVVMLMQPLDQPWLPKPFQTGGSIRKLAPLVQNKNNGEANPHSVGLELGTIDETFDLADFPPMFDMDFSVDFSVFATASSAMSSTPTPMALSARTNTPSSSRTDERTPSPPAIIPVTPTEPGPVALLLKVSISVEMDMNNIGSQAESSKTAEARAYRSKSYKANTVSSTFTCIPEVQGE